MTRKEQILQAARNYVSHVTLSSPSDVIHFGYGAKWADEHPNLESLWHDPSEEPQEYPIQCLNKQKDVWIECDLDPYVDGWDECVEFNELVRWAYVKDLLPKGGQK